jgi:hypothetical protein
MLSVISDKSIQLTLISNLKKKNVFDLVVSAVGIVGCGKKKKTPLVNNPV